MLTNTLLSIYGISSWTPQFHFTLETSVVLEDSAQYRLCFHLLALKPGQLHSYLIIMGLSKYLTQILSSFHLLHTNFIISLICNMWKKKRYNCNYHYQHFLGFYNGFYLNILHIHFFCYYNDLSAFLLFVLLFLSPSLTE